MWWAVTGLAARFRVLAVRLLGRLGFGEESFLVLLALLIGAVTAVAAVSFHELIDWVRRLLYMHLGGRVDLYGRGVAMLIALPAAGGLAVGLLSRHFFTAREGHGIVDVIESVIRSRGFIRPIAAIEKILTSAITIGSGGSAGAEGPIVQIGAAIASGVGQLFRVTRAHMPILIGCGSAAGISAIFNSPIGGVLFTLEVILRDFSIRAFAPVVIASVIANVATQALFRDVLGEPVRAIFQIPAWRLGQAQLTGWGGLGAFAILGLLSGLMGVAFTRLMHRGEDLFARMRLPRPLKPALGGTLLGLGGVFYVVVFGWLVLDQPKPFTFEDYAMPAFYGDGYGVVRELLAQGFYADTRAGQLLALLAFLCVAKILATCLTLASGGSGGIIAPCVFLGAATGGLLGMTLRTLPGLQGLQPHLLALVGMGAVLAAVVHAPLASILILLELTGDYGLVLPAMLASVIATGTARILFRDSIYTLSLRRRGLRIGTAADLLLLRRMTVEQVDLEPATVVRAGDSFQKVLDLVDSTGARDLVVFDDKDRYLGMLVAEDIQTALIQREAVPLLLAGELCRTGVPMVRNSDDLATVLDLFAAHNVDRLPVCVSDASAGVIGVISRGALMKRYQRELGD